ncbi:hypothetical protein ACFS5M_05365 [Lacinutrix iliipiscaria]|uniref:Secreted protein n=1 Tax=Lacinutrix iliipiscaria TaxID=1230532 RepID=A0ABW5WML4_9FLAO
MFKKVTSIIVLIFITYTSFSQNNVNDYKYVIVPNTFEFLKEADKYRLNTLTKLLFEKYGFIALKEDETLPDDIISNSCLALKSDVLKESGVFNTKLKVQLKNCKGDIIFTSQLGQSREKKYQVAYTLALREAFNSFEVLNYSYKENPAILAYGASNTQANNDEIEKLKEEISQLKEEKEKATTEVKVLPKEDVHEPVEVAVTTSEIDDTPSILYAQEITNGFQLVDRTPKVIYRIKKTGMNNVFLVEGKQAIIYQLDANWILEYYENQKLKTKMLNIKF